MLRVGYIDDTTCDKHIGCGPEVPDRTSTIRKVLMEDKTLTQLLTRKASIKDLELVHSSKYIENIQKKCSQLQPDAVLNLDSDVDINRDTYESACAAAGGVISAVDAVLTNSVTHVFCNVRPPGHHASSNRAAGFCIFNNVVIGVEHCLKLRPNYKIAIVDYDVHHGDGSEQIVKEKAHPNVYFFSLFNCKIYPGNVGPSDSTKRVENIPLTSSKHYRSHFRKSVIKELETLKPDLIFVSSGFDAHRLDPLGGFDLTKEDYAWMTKKLVKVTPHIISVLEGGYSLIALSESTRAVIEELKYACNMSTLTDKVSNVSI